MITRSSGMQWIWAGVIALIILRQDFWFWNDSTLVWGVLPIGLAWQIGISIAAAFLWYAATLFAWPADEELIDEVSATPLPPSTDATGEPIR